MLEALFAEENLQFLLHSVNLGEIYYDSLRTVGKSEADQLFTDIEQLPIHVIWKLTPAFLTQVGYYKTTERISFADSFVLALVHLEQATVISTDHHEFDTIEQKDLLSFYWLR